MYPVVSFDYFYGGESEQFSYYRIPRLLVTGYQFKNLSTDAKLLYGLMLDRMGLSARNGWYDERGRVYIYYSLEEVMADLNCGHDKAVKMLADLDTVKGIGLIERVKQGQGKPTIIYVKQFTTKTVPLPPQLPATDESQSAESRSLDFGFSEVRTSDNQNSGLRKIRSADFGKSEVQTSENQKSLYIIIILTVIILIKAIFTYLSINRINRLMRWIETDAELWSKRISVISPSPPKIVPRWTNW